MLVLDVNFSSSVGMLEENKMSLTSSLITLSALSVLLLGACGPVPQPAPQSAPTPTPAPQVTATPMPEMLNEIAYGLSYGMCLGYCEHRLSVTAERMQLVHQSRDAENYPEQVIEKITPPEIWQRLNALANFETLQALPDRLGCPDCADGGAAWVELQQNEASKRVTFEPQDGLPPQAELLVELRALYETLDQE